MTDSKNVAFRFQLGNGLTVTEAAVTAYEITSGRPRELAHEVVQDSHFSLSLETSSGGYFYVVAEIRGVRSGSGACPAGERVLQLVSVFDAKAQEVALSEPVTVATAYCFARFTQVRDGREVEISDPHHAAGIAYAMKKNFVGTDGAISPVISSSPNGLETNSFAMLNSLSNLVCASLTESEIYAELLRLTDARSLFGALFNLAREPFSEAQAIYELAGHAREVYSPTLASLRLPEGTSPVPSQWTLTIKRNDSGAQNFLIAGVGYAAFDKNDRAWLTNNVRQGTPNSSTFCVILEPDGSPAPFSPLFGGGLLGGGFGVAIDRAGETVYMGSFGWGPTEWNPQTGSIAVYSCEGEVLSPPNGYTAGLSRVQGMAVDKDGNLWMCSWGSQEPMPPTGSRFNYDSPSSAITVYLGGNPERMISYPFGSPYHLTFDVAFDDDGNAYVANSGNGANGIVSSIYKFRIEDGQLKKLAQWESDYVDPRDSSKVGFETFRQVAVSPNGGIFVVGVASSRVIQFDQDLHYVRDFKHNIHGPWGITFDTEGVMYVANFSRSKDVGDGDPKAALGPYGVTVLENEDESTAQLMTLPTGGSQVTLANGLPLYGNPQTASGEPIPIASYDPLMRLTATCIDRAGNLWALNNWKPSAVLDVPEGDPGGDGVVIFVGQAAPLPRG